MYALETIICSGVLYLLYRLLLEGRTAHNVARVFIVGALIVAVVVPQLELPILPAEPITAVALEEATMAESAEAVDIQTTADILPFDLYDVLLWVYIAVAVVLIFRFVGNIIHVVHLRRRCIVTHHNSYSIAVSGSIIEPFSFGKTVFLPSEDTCAQILIHERSHIAHNHTFEKMFFEVVRCVLWFNPFVHLFTKSISQVHEWQADSDVISRGYSIDEYRKIIFQQLFGYSPDITCRLNSNLTKKRFIMMTKFRTDSHQWWRLMVTIPIVVMMIFAFGAVCAEEHNSRQTTAAQQPKIGKIEIRDGGKTILLNSKQVSLEQLPEAIKSEPCDVVSIDCDDNVPMGSVADVKQILRTAANLKLVYEQSHKETASASANQNQTKAILSAQGAVAKKSEIKERNLLVVEVTADGSILLRDKKCSPNRLKREVKRFVQNYHIYALNTRKLHVGNLHREDYSEFTTTALTMPDGERMACPVSKGVVCIKSVEGAESDKVNQVRDIVTQAYSELRDRLAGRIYGKSYKKLDENGKSNINKAVPTQIYEIVGTVEK